MASKTSLFLPLVIILAAVVVAGFIVRPDFLFRRDVADAPTAGSPEPGEAEPSRWATLPDGRTYPVIEPPEGRQEYKISSRGGVYPRFASAVIDPPKVAVGETQFMRVVVESDAEVVSVVAEIETDNELQNIPLELVEVAALAREEIVNRKYIVRDDGALVINNGESSALAFLESLVRRAEAQDVKKFTFEGEWIVRDTHVKTYYTKFIARDELGREDSVTMAWLDPCSGTSDTDSTLSSNCTVGAGVVDGIDNGNLTINGGVTLTLNGGSPGATFVWNSGRSITASGTILIGDGAQLVQSNLWAFDADRDGVRESNTWAYGNSAPSGSYVRRYTISLSGSTTTATA